MRPVPVSGLLRMLAAVALVALVAAGRAEGQCEITGPAALCDGTAQLCAPEGEYMYEWVGPNGFFAMDRCITVSTPGAYFLSLFDMMSGLEFGPCQHDVAAAGAPATCSISGPASVCEGGAVELCGPDGSLSYAWSGPGGFTASSKCVTVSAGGTYSLVVSDLTGVCTPPSPPCDHTVTVNAAPAASISGPGEVCAGSSIELCGPGGSMSHAWSGPGGFTASTACAQVDAIGTYQLVVSDPVTGCASAPAQHEIVPARCQTLENCPRPVSFWRRECRERAERWLSDDDLVAVAASVDEHAAFFNWGGNARDGFCATLRPPLLTLARRAARQFAAVCANMCAWNLGLTLAGGHAIGLSPATRIELPGVSTSVGEWLTATDAELASLANGSARDPATKAAYRRIIRVAWQINHGLGIGPVCGDGGTASEPRTPAATSGLSATTDPGALLLDDEPLAVEMGDDDAALQLTRIEPNPFANNARIGFTVVSSETKNVSIGVYDLSGRLVNQLARGSFAPGAYEVRWDGRDDRGGLARNGIYFVHGRLDGQQHVRAQIILLR